MSVNIPVLDEIQTREKREGAEAIQQRIQPRQEDPLLRRRGRRMVYVQEPEQKCDCGGAQRNNRSYNQTIPFR